MQRKLFLYKILRPFIDRSVVTVRKLSDGKQIYDNKYSVNERVDKIVSSYLFKVVNGDYADVHGMKNIIKPADAEALLREIIQKQHLAYIGIDSPQQEVVLGNRIRGVEWFRNKNESRGKLSPHAYDTSKVKDVQSGMPFDQLIEWRDINRIRKYGRMGKVPTKIPDSKALIDESLDKLNECLGG
jgi:hypothetical protein